MRRKRTVKREVGDTLPWTCEATYEWKDMGADHHVRRKQAICITL